MPSEQHRNLTSSPRTSMKSMQNVRIVVLSFLAVQLALGGCASKYLEPAVPDPGDAVIIIRSSGMPMIVKYSISVDEEMCKGFETVGSVFANTAKGKILPWIARLDEKSRRFLGATTELKIRVRPNRPTQIKGYSNWTDYAAGTSRNGSCGPLVTQFTPAGSHTYFVEFLWDGTRSCTQAVFDITHPDEKIAIPVQTFSSCKQGWWSLF